MTHQRPSCFNLPLSFATNIFALGLASELSGIDIGPDLIERVFVDVEKSVGGVSVRALIRAFEQIETAAIAAGRDRIGLTDWARLTGDPRQLTAASKRKAPSARIELNAPGGPNQEQVA